MPFTDRPSSAKRRDDRSKDEQYYEKLQTIAADKGLLDEGTLSSTSHFVKRP